jgi:hypothetical protein
MRLEDGPKGPRASRSAKVRVSTEDSDRVAKKFVFVKVGFSERQMTFLIG